MDWTRRHLLLTAAAIATLAALPACGSPPGALLSEPNPAPSPERFLALCRALTGRTDLNPEHAALILSHLWRWRPAELQELVRQVEAAGPLDPAQLDQALTGEESQAMAQEILVAWYAGLLDSGQGERWCFTFTGALAWGALSWTSPQTLCASTAQSWGARP